MKQVRRPRRPEESGYALLMVFVLAATVAITLYMEMPRVAFESQRTKEQLLIDRGEQYKRAIQLFYRKTKRFPTTMEELEKFQEVRFLRRRYKDPMTGKEEWRIVHVGPGGQLTDSLVQKQQNPLASNGQNGQPGQNGPNGQQGGFGQSNPGFQSGFGSQQQASNQQPGQSQVQYNQNGIPISGADADTSGGAPSGINMAIARRHSDQMNLAGQGQGGVVNPNDPNQPDPNQDPNQPPDINGGQVVGQQIPGQQIPGQQNPAGLLPGQVPGQPGQPRYPGQPPFPPGVPGQPGQPIYPPGFQPGQNAQNGQPPINPNLPYQLQQQLQQQQQPQQQPQQNSFNNGGNSFNNGGNSFNNGGNSFNNGASNGALYNPALSAVQNSLFSARQPTSSFGSGNSPGGGVGIAGVATKYKGPSIKVVNERKKYQEWEFVYDMKKDKSLLGAAGVNALQNNPQNGAQSPGFGGFGNNQNQNSSGSGFGQNNSSGFGSGSSNGFGSTSSPQPQQPQQQQPQQQQQQ